MKKRKVKKRKVKRGRWKEEGKKKEGEKIDTDIESEIVAVVEAHKTNETTIPEPSKSIENPESSN